VGLLHTQKVTPEMTCPSLAPRVGALIETLFFFFAPPKEPVTEKNTSVVTFVGPEC